MMEINFRTNFATCLAVNALWLGLICSQSPQRITSRCAGTESCRINTPLAT